MIYRALSAAALVMSMPAVGQEMAGMNMDHDTDPGNAQIIVTINPEARVSAVAGKPLPPDSECGKHSMLQIKIINQGGMTAPLFAKLVDSPKNVMLSDPKLPLSGRAEDLLKLHMLSQRKEATDLTVAFSFSNGRGDLADRDRVHFLLRCTPTQ